MAEHLASLLRRALDGKPELWPVAFRVGVLQPYLMDPTCRVVRSDTVGRVSRPGGFSLDFGIAPDEQTIHATLGDLASRLPAREREHWFPHVEDRAFSGPFVKMLLNPMSCMDDGPIRPWRPTGG